MRPSLIKHMSAKGLTCTGEACFAPTHSIFEAFVPIKFPTPLLPLTILNQTRPVFYLASQIATIGETSFSDGGHRGYVHGHDPFLLV